MARYTPEQQRTIRRIKRSPAYKAASPRERKSVLLAAAVESNFRDLPYGDRDSEGALQQRPSQGWGSAAESLETDVAQYLSRARQANTQGGSAGQLAARVQRPAKEYEGRYDERSAEVDALLGKGSARPRSKGKGSSPRYEGTTTTKTIPGVDRSQDRRKLLAMYLLQRRDPDALLSLAQGLRGAQDTPDRTETVRTPARRPEQPRNAPQEGHGYPLAKRGQLIGAPHQGTHTLGNWQSDNAIDIKVKPGTPVLALEDGVIEKVGGRPGDTGRFGGYSVTLRGSNGYFYAHLSGVNVKPGQRIRRGQVIGRSGTANGVEHLHLGIERGTPDKRYR